MYPDDSYITLSPAVGYQKYVVMVMVPSQGDYISSRCSQALAKPAAEELAKSWAAAMRLEIR